MQNCCKKSFRMLVVFTKRTYCMHVRLYIYVCVCVCIVGFTVMRYAFYVVYCNFAHTPGFHRSNYLYSYVLVSILSYSTTVLYSRDHKGVGMAHKITSPKNQPKFSLTTMRQYWLCKLSLNKLSDQPKILSTSCYRILKRNLLNGIFY